jgi:serine/threonine protein kinase
MIEPGTLLQNRYRVTRQIGQGGMGAVYVATDERFHSTVAIKQTFFFDDPSLGRAFEREARLLNHLRHPALPKVSDHFAEGGEQFLVMEFIEGSDLGELLKARGGAFPVADVLRWADELLDVLEYLHNQKPPVVHRDIKPQNIKRTACGQIILLDFGLAKGTPAQTQVSTTGSVMGYSPLYAPLEQVQGTGTDPCSDIYSLGATLYHLLTGAAPVDALTRASAVINNQPDPLRPAHVANPQVPAAVGKVIHRAMAQKSTLRPQTAAEMRAMLRQAAGAGPYSALKPSAASGLARSQTVTDEVTVLEPLARTPGGSEATTLDGTTVDAKARGGQRHPARTQFAPPAHAPAEPARGSSAKLLIVAAVLAACAVAAFTVIPRSGAPASRPGAQSDASLGAPAGAQAGANATTPTAPTVGNPVSPPAATSVPPQSQSPAAYSGSGAPEADARTASGDAQQTAGGAAAGASDNPAPAAGAATQNSQPIVVVVQQATPTPQPADATAAAEEERRRAEDLQRRQAGPPPPPPDGRRPPPPGGQPPLGGQPPPRRPPFP